MGDELAYLFSEFAAAYEVALEEAMIEEAIRRSEEDGPKGPAPASAQVINSLEYFVADKAGPVGGSDSCVVCTSGFESKETVCILPCNHSFHRACIVPWLKLHGTCPTCRKNVSELSGNTHS